MYEETIWVDLLYMMYPIEPGIIEQESNQLISNIAIYVGNLTTLYWTVFFILETHLCKSVCEGRLKIG